MRTLQDKDDLIPSRADRPLTASSFRTIGRESPEVWITGSRDVSPGRPAISEASGDHPVTTPLDSEHNVWEPTLTVPLRHE
jgi:hypothetical protein